MGRLIDVADLNIALGMEMLCGNKTAIQVIQEAPTVEAIPKAEYENRLKADMVAMLEDLRLDFQEAELVGVFDNKELIFADEVDDLVQQKINSLKEASDGDK